MNVRSMDSWSERGFSHLEADVEGRGETSRGVSVGNAERWFLIIAGGALAAYGLSRRSIPGLATAIGGVALLVRGATSHCDARDSVSRSDAAAGDATRAALAGSRGINVEESVTINKPIEQIYRFWRHLENLPRFMNHLESVTTTGPNRSHWVAKAPAGLVVEWDAEIYNDVTDKLIAWRTLPGSQVVSAGSVNFDVDPNRGGTTITVRLQYNPPGGKLGGAIAKLFGEEPAQQISEDLGRLKQIFDGGWAS